MWRRTPPGRDRHLRIWFSSGRAGRGYLYFVGRRRLRPRPLVVPAEDAMRTPRTSTPTMSRRRFLLGSTMTIAAAGLPGCASAPAARPQASYPRLRDLMNAQVAQQKIPGAVLADRAGRRRGRRDRRGERRRRDHADAAGHDLPHRLDDQARDRDRGDDAGRAGQAGAGRPRRAVAAGAGQPPGPGQDGRFAGGHRPRRPPDHRARPADASPWASACCSTRPCPSSAPSTSASWSTVSPSR